MYFFPNRILGFLVYFCLINFRIFDVSFYQIVPQAHIGRSQRSKIFRSEHISTEQPINHFGDPIAKMGRGGPPYTLLHGVGKIQMPQLALYQTLAYFALRGTNIWFAWKSIIVIHFMNSFSKICCLFIGPDLPGVIQSIPSGISRSLFCSKTKKTEPQTVKSPIPPGPPK